MVENIFKPLDNKSETPLYAQLQNRLRDAVIEGQLKPDEVLPTERGIAETFSISRVTVRKAFDGLVEEGLLYRRQGAGTFVSQRIEKPFSAISSFSEDMRAQGLSPSSKWIDQSYGQIDAEECKLLELGADQMVYRLRRIRMADDTPLAVEYSVVPNFALALKENENLVGSLYEAMEACHHRPVRAQQRLRAISFPIEIADMLRVDVGAAGLYIERKGFARSGALVELTKSYYRGDAYDFVADLYAPDQEPGA